MSHPLNRLIYKYVRISKIICLSYLKTTAFKLFWQRFKCWSRDYLCSPCFRYINVLYSVNPVQATGTLNKKLNNCTIETLGDPLKIGLATQIWIATQSLRIAALDRFSSLTFPKSRPELWDGLPEYIHKQAVNASSVNRLKVQLTAIWRGRVIRRWNFTGPVKSFSITSNVALTRAQWLRGRASDSQLRGPGFESCAAVIKSLACLFTLHFSSSLSYINEYPAIASGGFVYEHPSRINCSIWLDASQRNWNGV